MRRFRILVHLFLLALLVVAAGWIWKNAWVVSGAVSPIRLAPGPNPPGKTLRGAEFLRWEPERGVLVLRGNFGGAMPSHEIPLSGWPRGSAAHIRFSGQAREIVRGPEEWQDGRVMLIWRKNDGSIIQRHNGLLGAKDSGYFELEYVAVLDQPGQVSVFLQHAGFSGEFQIDSLEITPVGLRRWVPWATGALLGATGIWWAWLFMGITGRKGVWRPLGASALGLVTVWAMVLPGPWEPLRPLGGPFALQPSIASLPAAEPAVMPIAEPVVLSLPAPAMPPTATPPAITLTPPPVAAAPTTPSPAEAPDASSGLPVPGALDSGWLRETYRRVKMRARGLMHFGVFSALTLGFVAMLESKRGWMPVAILGIASEVMQTLFGFGFGWEDAGDLTVNGLGIGLGLLALAGWKKWRGRPARP